MTAATVASDAAPLAGGESQLAVLLGALKRLAGAPSGELTAHALCGAAALLRVATRLELSLASVAQAPALDMAAARRLRDASCAVLAAAGFQAGAEPATPLLLPRLLAIEALVASVAAIGTETRTLGHNRSLSRGAAAAQGRRQSATRRCRCFATRCRARALRWRSPSPSAQRFASAANGASGTSWPWLRTCCCATASCCRSRDCYPRRWLRTRLPTRWRSSLSTKAMPYS